MPKKDMNQIAFATLLQATGEAPKPVTTLRQENGRKGGLKGGKKRMELLTPEQKSELGKKAREARRIKEALTSKEVSANAKNQLNKVN
jgi:hypothetical protein